MVITTYFRYKGNLLIKIIDYPDNKSYSIVFKNGQLLMESKGYRLTINEMMRRYINLELIDDFIYMYRFF